MDFRLHEWGCQSICIMWRHLSTVFTINLVTVKWSRVVTGSNHDTCETVEVTNCKWQFWSWTEAFKYVRFDTMFCKNCSRFKGKLRWEVTAIVGNCYTTFFSFPPLTQSNEPNLRWLDEQRRCWCGLYQHQSNHAYQQYQIQDWL